MKNARIDLDANHLELIAAILSKYLPPNSRAWLFGSRAMAQAKIFSDIDLLIDTGKALTLAQRSLLEKEFDESLLPYKVDLVDARTISAAFKAAIESQLVSIYP